MVVSSSLAPQWTARYDDAHPRTSSGAPAKPARPEGALPRNGVQPDDVVDRARIRAERDLELDGEGSSAGHVLERLLHCFTEALIRFSGVLRHAAASFVACRGP